MILRTKLKREVEYWLEDNWWRRSWFRLFECLGKYNNFDHFKAGWCLVSSFVIPKIFKSLNTFLNSNSLKRVHKLEVTSHNWGRVLPWWGLKLVTMGPCYIRVIQHCWGGNIIFTLFFNKLRIVHTFGKGFAYKPKLINYLAYITWISRIKKFNLEEKKTTLRLTPLFMTTKAPAVFDQATPFALQR